MYAANIGAQVSPPSGSDDDSGGAARPTVEHLDTGASTNDADPEVDVTFCRRTFGPTSIEVTLDAGPYDGFTKTIRCAIGAEWTIVPTSFADGTDITIDGLGEDAENGAVVLIWNDDTTEWGVLSLFNATVA